MNRRGFLKLTTMMTVVTLSNISANNVNKLKVVSNIDRLELIRKHFVQREEACGLPGGNENEMVFNNIIQRDIKVYIDSYYVTKNNTIHKFVTMYPDYVDINKVNIDKTHLTTILNPPFHVIDDDITTIEIAYAKMLLSNNMKNVNNNNRNILFSNKNRAN